MQVDYIRIYESFDSHTWTSVTELPISGDAHATTPIISEIAAMLPDGRLAVLGDDPHRTQPLPTTITQHFPDVQQWLWIWQPQTARWSYLDAPLTLSHGFCGLCWMHFSTEAADAHGMPGDYIWIWDHDAHPDAIYRIFVPNPPHTEAA
jgi:hypothetical protein